jgi:hypothetical protein
MGWRNEKDLLVKEIAMLKAKIEKLKDIDDLLIQCPHCGFEWYGSTPANTDDRAGS